MSSWAGLSKEWQSVTGFVRALKRTKPIPKNPHRLFTHVIEEMAVKHGQRSALISEGQSYTYAQLDTRANQYAHWGLAQGLRKGDTVALFMPNCAEFIIIWIGLTRIGCVVALINTNLTGAALAHSFTIAKPKHIFCAAALEAAFETAKPQIDAPDYQCWGYGEGSTFALRLDKAVAEQPGHTLAQGERPPLTIEDKALYIYTSGTTGMPKAANVNHYRIMAITHGFGGAMNITSNDRMYVCLPMYHSVGGVLASGSTLVSGGSVVIRDKFSAREFWDDIVKYECTLFQYIGELCRYLVNTSSHPLETSHKIRLCCGNGLRPDIWESFRDRFKLPKILEFYAATEGNVALFNFDGTVGSVGRIPKWAKRFFTVDIVKFDVEKEEPIRTPEGLCQSCEPDEIGEVIGQVLNDPSKPANRFEGYADKEATSKKLLWNVFTKGDVWFRTGDLMRRDAKGYFYFVDRIGDTFRWKGENVSTLQVSEVITLFPGVDDANVYGVAVAKTEGRAGMASIVAPEGIDFVNFYAYLEKHLPDYARPVFLRMKRELPITGTFKQKKTDLVAEGFDINRITDEIWFSNPQTRRYERLDTTLYNGIITGTQRL